MMKPKGHFEINWPPYKKKLLDQHGSIYKKKSLDPHGRTYKKSYKTLGCTYKKKLIITTLQYLFTNNYLDYFLDEIFKTCHSDLLVYLRHILAAMRMIPCKVSKLTALLSRFAQTINHSWNLSIVLELMKRPRFGKNGKYKKSNC